MSFGRCANNIHPVMGRMNTTFCSLFMMCVCIVIILHISNSSCWGKTSLSTLQLWTVCCTSAFISMNHYCVTTRLIRTQRILTETSHGFSKPWFLCRICSVWRNIESVMCFLLPESWQRLCSVLPFHRWAPLQQGLFVLYELTTDPTDHKSCWKRSERVA